MSQIPKQFRQVSVTSTAVLVDAGKKSLMAWNLISPSTTSCYLKLCDAATAGDVTPGTTAVKKTLLIPGGPGTSFLTNEQLDQLAFTLGVVAYVTTGIADNDTTAPGTGCYVELYTQDTQ